MNDTQTTPARPDVAEDDHDRFSHWCKSADIVRASVEGTPAVALCGKRWIPHRNPDRYPVCPTCKEIYEGLFGDAA